MKIFNNQEIFELITDVIHNKKEIDFITEHKVFYIHDETVKAIEEHFKNYKDYDEAMECLPCVSLYLEDEFESYNEETQKDFYKLEGINGIIGFTSPKCKCGFKGE